MKLIPRKMATLVHEEVVEPKKPAKPAKVDKKEVERLHNKIFYQHIEDSFEKVFKIKKQ